VPRLFFTRDSRLLPRGKNLTILLASSVVGLLTKIGVVVRGCFAASAGASGLLSRCRLVGAAWLGACVPLSLVLSRAFLGGLHETTKIHEKVREDL